MAAGRPADLVVGIDSSTTATKAIAWTRDGEAVAQGRSPLPLDNPAPGHYEQPAEAWWTSACQALSEMAGQIDPARIAAVAIANQRETFVPLDADGQPLRPAIVWVDERCRDEVAGFAAEIGREAIHRITGKPPDMTPVCYRLAWMRRFEPDLLARTALVADVHAYLVLRLTGHARTSTASADPLGLYDMDTGQWSAPILSALGLSGETVPEACRPGTVLGPLTDAAAAATVLRAGTPVVAGGGDGQAAGLGVNALSADRAYLNLGTAAVSGVYSGHYRADTAWRTMGSLTGRGCYLETCLRTGTFLVDWFVRQVCGVDPAEDPGIYQRLEAEAARLPVGAEGLLLVPYWSGAMPPFWDVDARGALVGLGPRHTRGHIYRAVMEGVALDQALATSAVERQAGISVQAYVAIGGGAQSDLWCRMVAAATGKRVLRSATVEASSLGAAMTASVGAGLYPDAAAAAAGMAGQIVSTFDPEPDGARRYAQLLALYRQVYPQLADVYAGLARFAEED
jgi:xylulokinase